MALSEKRCSVCKTTKPLDDFHRLHSEPDGRICRCKVCVRAKNNAYYASNKEAVKAKVKTWRDRNPERVRQIGLAYYAKRDKAKTNRRVRIRYGKMHPQKKRDIRLRSKYGITVERFEEMSESQSHACAICLKTEKLVVDHNHETGDVRGLLCHKCNSALGMLMESERSCLNMVAYIQRYSGDRE